ncbi:MAG: hypothetical protein ACOX7K_00400 [Oscillospiraceae bacterium]
MMKKNRCGAARKPPSMMRMGIHFGKFITTDEENRAASSYKELAALF